MCRSVFGPVFHIDHVVPKAINPTRAASGLQALCANCHAVKTVTDNAATRAAKRAGCRWRCGVCGAVVSSFFAHVHTDQPSTDDVSGSLPLAPQPAAAAMRSDPDGAAPALPWSPAAAGPAAPPLLVPRPSGTN